MELSTKHIFSKFDTFCSRINILLEILDWRRALAQVSKCNLDTVRKACESFESALTAFQCKHQDVLDISDNVRN